jgi:glycosyltransferase involved in cell wall biosynthesis
MSGRLRILHAIHDFLPRHRAGSEIYACELARQQSSRHDVFVLAAEYDPATPHGTLRWRAVEGLPVIEVVNNWEFRTLYESHSSPRLNAQLEHAIDATRPDILHVHNLLNLTFDLPRLARERGARVVATLHDYTLLCASGGQRVHQQESHVCHEIDPERCSRCFSTSAFHRQMAVSRATGGAIGRAAAKLHARMPWLTSAISRRAPGPAIASADIVRRLAAARQVFGAVDLFVAPSAALGAEFVRFGLPPARLEVSDYGFRASTARRAPSRGMLRIGFAGTLVWHKGVHVLLEAARRLRGAFELQIHGDPNVFPEYTVRLKELAAGLPVRFAGCYAPEDVASVFGQLDVLVVPSLWPENSPLVIHEAFMHGVAVVGAATGGIPDLVRDGGGLVYDPTSPAELAGVLQRLIDDPTISARLGQGAPAVKSIEQDALEWDARYNRLLDASRQVPELVAET